MKVTVIIPSLYTHDKDYLNLCVKSLRASGCTWDIVVVTNGTKTAESIGEISGMCKRLHTRDQGQCGAVNIGASAVSPDTDYIMVSNSDMYYPPGWDKKLRFDYPVFSPNLVEPTNNAGSAPPFLKFSGGLDLEEFNQGMVDGFIERKTDAIEPDEPGFNMPFFIKKDLWDFLGGYDVNYDPWGSNCDTDLQTRINLAGITPMRLRNVLVYHFGNKTPTFSPENDAFRRNNFEYFYDKFGFDRDELKSDVWYNKDMIPEDKERIKYDQKPYIS